MENQILELLQSMKIQLDSLQQEQQKTNERLANLEDGQERIEKKLDSISDQTADLIEFRTDTTEKLDKLINVTKNNCFEIMNLKIVK